MRRGSGGGAERRRPPRGGRPRRARLVRLVVAVAVALGLTALAGCAPTDSGGFGPRFVTPPLIRYSSVLWPVPLQLVGAEPGSRLRLSASVTTDRGTWGSSATYTVPANGTLDLATARPQLAPFREPDSIGLYWSLRGPELSGRDLARQWMRETLPVRLTASAGDRVVAERTFRLQGLAADLRPRTVYTRDLVAAEVQADGGDAAPGSPGSTPPVLPRQTHEDQPIGRYWGAATLERPVTPAVLMFDDTSPGASGSFVAPVLAQLGASVFVLPVTGDGDGVLLSSVVDAGTVDAVLDWLGQRADVDPRKLFVYGTGASEQLALWAANRFGSRFEGVFAAGGVPALVCTPSGASPVVEQGTDWPCRVAPAPVTPASMFRLDHVPGAVVLACAEHDEVLPEACSWQQALATGRVSANGSTSLVADAAHAITVPPGLPIALPEGALAQPTEQARIAFWDAVGRVVLRAARS
ncbi:acyl-CoA thioesterase/BAAT N-terminal domain-containing protein [Leifsonia sp. F6_8S_P_1B]|uniref:Acyl-CoA thioesterase/BAAT N-terminal domain-containing protein n=1 Tax=Leifsonia williamsii TaxID=3035919 RepID=A0ABT8KA04_9MICO|nr:acyl-CoA thioesterase/BAAT N-terminal domain-containing protein [Leifsonia williamsii]MDN4614288.1 acyl-CoA thioesterase/BAAT N-terminal domain-containing protein [Leifsonia williamsii]